MGRTGTWMRLAGLAGLLAYGLLASGLPAAAQGTAPETGPSPSSGPNVGSVPNADPAPKADAEVWPDKAMTDEEAAAAGRLRLPLTTEQIELLGRLLRQTQEATARARGNDPQGRVRKVRLDPLGPEAVQEVAVRAGYVTSVGFYDRTGAPWPIAAVAVDERFAASRREGLDHLVHFSPAARWLAGNASVMLEGFAEPVILLLGEREGVADFRVDLRLSAAGPNADPLALSGVAGFHAGSDVLLGLLSGEAPAGAVPLDVEGVQGRAWRLGDEVLLVTRAHVLSPGPRAAERDPAGRWAYRLPGVPYAMVSQGGRELRAAFLDRTDIPQPTREN